MKTVRRTSLKAAMTWLAVMCCATAITPPAHGQETESPDAKTPSLAVGERAPGFELSTLGGERVSLDQYRGADGKSVVVTFVRAHW